MGRLEVVFPNMWSHVARVRAVPNFGIWNRKIGKAEIKTKSESEFQVRQLEDLFRNHCTKRNIDASAVTMDDKPVHSGKTFTLNITFKQGIEQEDAKKIIKHLKESKLKVQAGIQGDKVRVTGKNRDDLQEAIAILKKFDIALSLQFNNFRD